MALHAVFVKKTFQFSFRVRTSRGAMTHRDSWFVKIINSGDNEIFGIGEAAPLPGLSKELDDDFEKTLDRLLQSFNAAKLELGYLSGSDLADINKTLVDKLPDLIQFSSILFALETALLDLINGGQRIIFKNEFVKGQPIPINGLIWMSGMDLMLQQIEIKIQEGFDCLKLKVGGLDFEKECDILQYVRRKYFKMNITLRLDANGAFKEEEAMYKLNELAKFNIHSIEQPVKVGSAKLAGICKESPIPIALDEELIGVNGEAERKILLEKIQPSFIILKPSLHGGLTGCRQWIAIANELKIGWWMTSALESSYGLNSIAQFTAEYDNKLPQGLGTGKIFEDNFESPLKVTKGNLGYNGPELWQFPDFN